MIKQFNHIAFFHNQKRTHTPGKIELSADLFIHRTANNLTSRAITGDHTCRGSGLRYCQNPARVQVVRSRTGCMTNRVRNIRTCFMIVSKETFAVIDILFRTYGNAHHRLQRFDRIIPCRCFAGKHNRTRTVINGIRHIGRLRPGRPWIFHHGVQHLGCGNYFFACFIYFFDNHLLDNRHFLARDLHAHIPARNHNSL